VRPRIAQQRASSTAARERDPEPYGPVPPEVLPEPPMTIAEPTVTGRAPEFAATERAYESTVTERAPSDIAARETRELVVLLAADLATATDPGIGLVYRALDELAARHALRDVVVVVDDPVLGHQVFRARRQPIDNGSIALLEAEPGIYTDPPLQQGEIDEGLLLYICTLALRFHMLRYEAWHDPLTGLYDRRSFDRLLKDAVARSRRYGWSFTLVILDLDDFKSLNDWHGHAAGDDALRRLADRFRRTLRAGDDAARIGGDEFALILPDTSPADVPALLARVSGHDRGDSVEPFSYGLAACPEEADDFDALFRLADARLYQAKHRQG